MGPMRPLSGRSRPGSRRWARKFAGCGARHPRMGRLFGREIRTCGTERARLAGSGRNVPPEWSVFVSYLAGGGAGGVAPLAVVFIRLLTKSGNSFDRPAAAAQFRPIPREGWRMERFETGRTADLGTCRRGPGRTHGPPADMAAEPGHVPHPTTRIAATGIDLSMTLDRRGAPAVSGPRFPLVS